ncbi:DUF4976 domain-containing protein [Puteibacter caeruleilacunae]|nr:DUF4976 domain-containing protein [Puteibacter caeruleilacunae]
MNTKHLMIVGASLLSLGMHQAQGKESKTSRPNILFIMSDDHAYQAISSYDNSLIKTPNIDRIAQKGVLFEHAFVTNSICAPSRAVLLTGKLSHKNGHINNRSTFDGSQQTFPKLLQKAGYQTAIVGKWHLKSDPTGFDYWNVLPGQGSYYNPDFIEMGEKKRIEGYSTTLTTDFALQWLDEDRDQSKPFCLLLHHKAPHRNWKPEEKYLNLYDDKDFPLPENFFDEYENRGKAAKEQEMSIAKDMKWGHDMKLMKTPEGGDSKFEWELKRFNDKQLKAWHSAYGPKNEKFLKEYKNMTPEEVAKWKYQRYIKDYLRCIKSVDDNVGRVLDYLEEKGLADNTIIVYTSDQGFYLGEHGWFDKRFMYEQSHRTPLLMRVPGQKGGKKIDELVMNLDFASTFLDYAGVDIPADIQGESLKPLLSGKHADWRDAVYYHYYEYPAVHQVKRHYGIRTERYKLIHFYHDVDEWELYDLKKDPMEMNNIYDEQPELAEKLKKQLEELQEKYDDHTHTDRAYLKR